ncbi:putative exported protein [Gluconacetobacter diazotrophicus PA1 5]|uniref:Putative exported protein n=1 Tax=Gluconacetobacter diazotrophicus (strain ATCC 49037 / DSM 5601 / CCUG 37298 / CIP 103539 / LMG 7603 / PAl5) TaxID=272568 RepID=A9HMB0_GLUDA|nr:putative exported protein [Gluconacetobacter diazotrophicus PA1 5]
MLRILPATLAGSVAQVSISTTCGGSLVRTRRRHPCLPTGACSGGAVRSCCTGDGTASIDAGTRQGRHDRVHPAGRPIGAWRPTPRRSGRPTLTGQGCRSAPGRKAGRRMTTPCDPTMRPGAARARVTA